jgi:hypothetical protein
VAVTPPPNQREISSPALASQTRSVKALSDQQIDDLRGYASRHAGGGYGAGHGQR